MCIRVEKCTLRMWNPLSQEIYISARRLFAAPYCFVAMAESFAVPETPNKKRAAPCDGLPFSPCKSPKTNLGEVVHMEEKGKVAQVTNQKDSIHADKIARQNLKFHRGQCHVLMTSNNSPVRLRLMMKEIYREWLEIRDWNSKFQVDFADLKTFLHLELTAAGWKMESVPPALVEVWERVV